MICKTPDYIGWSLVAVAGALCLVMMIALGKIITTAIKERKED